MADNPLWEYSLEVYGRPGVQQACLTLQDEFGADINLLLFAAWVAAQGAMITPGQWHTLHELSDTFQQQYLQPLRNLRRKLKSVAPDAAYEGAKALELELERWQQGALWEFWQEQGVAGRASAADLLWRNCRGGFERGDYHPGAGLDAALQRLVDALEASS